MFLFNRHFRQVAPRWVVKPHPPNIGLRRVWISLLGALVFTVSACSTDSSAYNNQTEHADTQLNYYVRGGSNLAHDKPAYPLPNDGKPPDFREYGQHRDSYPWLRVGPNLPIPENRAQDQMRIERQRFDRMQQIRERTLEQGRGGSSQPGRVDIF